MRLYLAAYNDIVKYVSDKPKYVLTTFMEGEKSCLNMIKLVGVDNFILDSGAFTFMNSSKGPVDFMAYQETYIDFINKANVRYFFNLDLDTIIGVEKTKQMRDILENKTHKRCIPVWHKCMGLESWKQLTKEYDYVAIGTIQDVRGKPAIIRKLTSIAKENNCKVHGLGFTPKNVEQYGFFSVDSTSWKTGYRFGNIEKFDGRNVITVASRQKGQTLIDYKRILRHNLPEWIKYQEYLDKEKI